MINKKVFCTTEVNLTLVLDAVIKTKGLTRDRVAQETGISSSSLSYFFNHKIGLSISSIERLCQFLGVPQIEISNVSNPSEYVVPLEMLEKEAILKALNKYNWNIDLAYVALGCTKYYLYSRIRKFDLKKG